MAKHSIKLSDKRVWIPLVAILLLAAGAAGYLLWRNQTTQTSVSEASPYETTQVRQGDIVRSASGAGTLVSGDEADLSFPVSGTVAEVYVTVGDKVSAGDVLAVLEGIDALQVDVETKQIALDTAQNALDDITNNADQTLAEAQLALAEAQGDYAEAQDSLLTTGQERCDDKLTRKYYFQYLEIQKLVDYWQGELDGESKYGRDFILEHLNKYKKERDTAYANWSYCDSYTDQEVAESQATLQLTKATMDLAQVTYDRLAQTDGVDQADLALAQAQVEDAQEQLTTAENTLSAATITAPFDGTILSVGGVAGDQVDTATFIVLADLDHPAIQAYVDESDLQNIAVGCSASISFESIPDRIFTGEVSEITPQLIASGNYNAIQTMIDLTSFTLIGDQTVPLGLSASTEISCGQASNVPLIPVDALHELSDGTVVVYVLGADGVPEQRVVEIGVQDYTNVEILSGLQPGELVITQGPGIPG